MTFSTILPIVSAAEERISSSAEPNTLGVSTQERVFSASEMGWEEAR